MCLIVIIGLYLCKSKLFSQSFLVTSVIKEFKLPYKVKHDHVCVLSKSLNVKQNGFHVFLDKILTLDTHVKQCL